MRRLALLCTLLLVLIVIPTSAHADPVMLAGNGIQQTAPLQLDGGIYVVRWTATPGDGQRAYFGALFYATEQTDIYRDLIGGALVESNPISGESYIYGVTPGTYFFRVSASCPWTMTIEPVQ